MTDLGPYSVDSIVVGDCLSVMARMPDGCVDLVVADPPYGEINRPDQGLRRLDKGDADVVTVSNQDWLTETLRILRGSIYIFCGVSSISELWRVLEGDAMSCRFGFWQKSNPSPMNGQYLWLSACRPILYGKKRRATFNEYCKALVFTASVVRGIDHPTPKPLAVIERMVDVSSNKTDIVFDPFCGSGTTPVAAKKLGRHYFGCDINSEYVAMSRKRLSQVQTMLPGMA